MVYFDVTVVNTFSVTVNVSSQCSAHGRLTIPVKYIKKYKMSI